MKTLGPWLRPGPLLPASGVIHPLQHKVLLGRSEATGVRSRVSRSSRCVRDKATRKTRPAGALAVALGVR